MKQERNSFLTDAAEIKMKGNLRLYKKFAESVNSCCLNMAKLLIFKFSYIEQFFSECLWKSLHIHDLLVLRTCH